MEFFEFEVILRKFHKLHVGVYVVIRIIKLHDYRRSYMNIRDLGAFECQTASENNYKSFINASCTFIYELSSFCHCKCKGLFIFHVSIKNSKIGI